MNEWYLPITIIPGIGMLILSTSSQLMGLSSEIASLISKEHDDFIHEIAERKIRQLSLLTKANFFLYLSVALYVLSGILGALSQNNHISHALPQGALYTGTVMIFISIVLLNIYAFRAVKIRRAQFRHTHTQ